MTKKFATSLTPWHLFLIGGTIGKIENELVQSTTYCKQVKQHLDYLALYKDERNFGFIGKGGNHWFDHLEEKYSSEDACLDSEEVEALKSDITKWVERLREISKNWFLCRPDTHLDTSKLRGDVKAFLSRDESNTLEPLEEQSLSEAISSLLFGNFISAEFMALRTAESLLKKWYEKKTGKKLGRTPWGQVLDKLNEEFPEKERPKELHLLDYLRERRNEIAHPEAVSDSLAASTTFLNVISLCKSLLLQLG